MKIFTYVFGIWDGYDGALSVGKPFAGNDKPVKNLFLYNTSINQYIMMIDKPKTKNDKEKSGKQRRYTPLSKRVIRTKDLYPAYQYEVKNTEIVVDPKNMNIKLVHTDKKESELTDDSLVFVTISSKAYKICECKSYSEVIASYHTQDYQGIIIRITKEEREKYEKENAPFFTFTGRKIKINRFVKNELKFNPIAKKDNYVQLQAVCDRNCFNGDKLSMLRTTLSRYERGILMKPSLKNFYTNVIIYSKANTYGKLIDSIKSDYEKRGIELSLFPVSNMRELKNVIEEISKDKQLKAISFIDVYDIYRFNIGQLKTCARDHRIFNLINYDSRSRIFKNLV